MGLLTVGVGFLVNFLNFFDKILQRLGIKLCDVNRDHIIKGLPEGAEEELQKADIKKYTEAIFEDGEALSELNLLGRVFLSNFLKQNLKTRLLIKETIQQIPDLLKLPIKRPIFIVGHYRTGTTFLNWLLACDAQFRCPARWEQEAPCPPGPVENVLEDPRYRSVVKGIDIMRLLNDKSFVTHPMGADKPEECVLIQKRSFVNPVFFLTFKNYAELFFEDKATARHMYEYYKVILQVLCWGHDPMGEVRKLYAFLGMNLIPEVESAMNSCIKNEFKLGTYRTPLFEDSTLFSKDSVQKDFEEYLDLMPKRADRSYLI